jgi:hypothetical protein
MPAVFFSASAGHAEEIPVSRFSTEGLAGWESKSFKGVTEYRLVNENGRLVVKATSHAAASGLIRKIRFDPSKYRYVRWSWKIAHTIKGGDEKSKAGDDYAARVYVVFPGRYFWQMKAISYIWANKLIKGESVPSVYAANAGMVAVESGNEKAGQRLAEAIAIMTDTDNTGESADAWYGEISLSTEGK